MAVELMMGFRNIDNGFSSSSSSSLKNNIIEENNAVVEEAASAGLESVEKLIGLLSQRQVQYQQASVEKNSKVAMEIEMDCKVVTDLAVNKFKKVISLLGRTRTGHARFRRGPSPISSPPTSQPQSFQQQQQQQQAPFPQQIQLSHHEVIESVKEEKQQCSGSRIYCPTPIQRLPPLPHHHQYNNQHPSHQSNSNGNQSFGVVKNGVLERKESSKTITFASSPQISASNSFMSSLTGDTDSKQPSSSSAFQITNLSQISSSSGRPPLCSSMKRKCSSLDEGGAKCGGGTGRCHCSKRRKSRVKKVVRIPAISLKMADIPPDDFSWRKYGQKPIKGSPHPRCVHTFILSIPLFFPSY
ncbi:hypothetical protein AQUCO_00700730v1 [Aquilegia coerulea]|uniref:WRKY domain-containing protein n=1 Tax=Aquilegia coerulea TaxID=218851 RepID=A0A2G5ELK0_AQUCA|nr:hypothetical protein AQUCO_00700730v1 [Aquilegia coerulea]